MDKPIVSWPFDGKGRPREGWAGSWSYDWPEEICAGCGRPIADHQYARINDAGQPYHWDCDPDRPKDPPEEPDPPEEEPITSGYLHTSLNYSPRPRSLRERIVELAHRFRFTG